MRRPKAVSQDLGDWYTLVKRVYWCILGYRACADVPKTARSNIKIIFVNRGSHSGCHSEHEFDGTAELPVLSNNTDHSYCETEKKNCITVHAVAEAVLFVTAAGIFLICC